MTTIDQSGTATFADELRAATWGDHEGAEHAPFVVALSAGGLDVDSYALLVEQHWQVYRTLEAAAEAMRDHPVAGRFVDDALHRTEALELDLRVLRGDDWATTLRTVPATDDYCRRIADVCFTWPGGFVAHHYTRYLGDLSGGRFLAGAVARHYGATPGAGASFYEFGGIDDARGYKAAYRRRLDEAGWSAAERRRIIGEVLEAYRCNTALFADLGSAVGAAEG